MNTNIIEKQNIDLTAAMRSEIAARVDSLDTVLQQPEAHTEVDITKGGHGGFTVSATIAAAGERYHAEAVRSSIMEGVDEVVGILRDSISKSKNKARVMAKRAGDMFKKMARFGRG
jgi:ribosome-associated translation inhibitor RaiA